jgi:hypothetical protein
VLAEALFEDNQRMQAELAAALPDAARWRSLLACERIRFIGGARLGGGDPIACFEFHRRHPARDDADAREKLLAFAEVDSAADHGDTAKITRLREVAKETERDDARAVAAWLARRIDEERHDRRSPALREAKVPPGPYDYACAECCVPPYVDDGVVAGFQCDMHRGLAWGRSMRHVTEPGGHPAPHDPTPTRRLREKSIDVFIVDDPAGKFCPCNGTGFYTDGSTRSRCAIHVPFVGPAPRIEVGYRDWNGRGVTDEVTAALLVPCRAMGCEVQPGEHCKETGNDWRDTLKTVHCVRRG